MYSDAAKPIRGRFRTSSRRDLPLVEEWISKSDRWEFHRLGGPVGHGGFPLVAVSVRLAAPSECAWSSQVRPAPPLGPAYLDQVQPVLLRLVYPDRFRWPSLSRPASSDPACFR